MIIDSIQNGIVIDHITAGKAMELYNILGLDKLECTVAILKNVTSGKLGRKDILKYLTILQNKITFFHAHSLSAHHRPACVSQ